MALTTKDAARLLETRFGIAPDCPFLETDAMVFRHPASRRWFALFNKTYSKLLILGFH